MEATIKVKNLNKKYEGFELKNISFEIPEGSIVGLIGENGAGKTTTIKSILNIINSEGEIQVLGKDIKQNEKEIKSKLGVVLDDSFLSEYLTPKKINSIMKDFYNTWDKKLFEKYIKIFKLPENKMIKDFSSGMKMKLKIAVPSKGRISDPSISILEKAGLGLKDNANRKLISATFNKDIDVMFARASDIPKFVEDEIVDMGITGVDLINESEANVKELVDLSFGQTKLVLASPEDSTINSIDDLTSDMVVATEFPTLTKKYLEEHGLTSKIITLSGSTEIAPLIGIADLITDLTSTGTTLKMNHLKIVDVILESTIKLITNDNSFENKKELVEAVSTSIKGVIEAERKKLVMMNVKKENLDKVKKVMPAMTGPTISEVLSKEETVAVQAVIDEDVVFELVNDLRNAGAKDILVVPIERII